jgi:gluconate 2-dehydrogenase gamma chain
VSGAFRSTRRRFVEALAGAATALLLPVPRARGRRVDASETLAARPASASHPGVFSDAERQTLAGLANHVLPGAAELGAVEYVEQLLTAFDFDPPRIHAGGPFSGRRPFAQGGGVASAFPPDGFADWVPLDRVSERAWRLRLFGAQEGDPLGPVVGLRPLLKEGAGLALGARSPARAWSAQNDEFRRRFRELVLEACFSDPVYGGNRGEAGWRSIDFEGDTLPLGFMPWDESAGRHRERPDAPYSKLGSLTDDPAPLGWRMRAYLWLLAFLSRRVDPF